MVLKQDSVFRHESNGWYWYRLAIPSVRLSVRGTGELWQNG